MRKIAHKQHNKMPLETTSGQRMHMAKCQTFTLLLQDNTFKFVLFTQGALINNSYHAPGSY